MPRQHFVGERVEPLLHLRWTVIVNVHLVILGGIPQQATIVTPQGVFFVAIHRFAMAMALLLLLGGRQIPSYFLNSQERECCQVETQCLGI